MALRAADFLSSILCGGEARPGPVSNNKYHSCELSVGARINTPIVGLTRRPHAFKMCVFFLYCSRSEAYAGFVFIEIILLWSYAADRVYLQIMNFFVNPAETGYSRLNFGLTLR